jgi:hypothetical protein
VLVEIQPIRRSLVQERMVRLRSDEVDAMKSILATVALLLASSPVLADSFVLLIHETPDQLALRSDAGAAGQAYWAAYADFGKQAAEAGVLRGGAAMVPQPVAQVGQAAAPGALLLGGFFLIDVADAAAAAEWAAKLPAAATGGVEIRAAVSAPGM